MKSKYCDCDTSTFMLFRFAESVVRAIAKFITPKLRNRTQTSVSGASKNTTICTCRATLFSFKPNEKQKL
jgi:hypothetical protein